VSFLTEKLGVVSEGEMYRFPLFSGVFCEKVVCSAWFFVVKTW
jgi:hypothetical protein